MSDRYYQGTILRVNAGSRTGWIRGQTGRDVPFDVAHLELLGTSRGFAALREGLRVGFDVGRTSHGLCVTVIRVYEPPGSP